jgi:hypothetical protein
VSPSFPFQCFVCAPPLPTPQTTCFTLRTLCVHHHYHLVNTTNNICHLAHLRQLLTDTPRQLMCLRQLLSLNANSCVFVNSCHSTPTHVSASTPDTQRQLTCGASGGLGGAHPTDSPWHHTAFSARGGHVDHSHHCEYPLHRRTVGVHLPPPPPPPTHTPHTTLTHTHTHSHSTHSTTRPPQPPMPTPQKPTPPIPPPPPPPPSAHPPSTYQVQRAWVCGARQRILRLRQQQRAIRYDVVGTHAV